MGFNSIPPFRQRVFALQNQFELHECVMDALKSGDLIIVATKEN